MKYRNKPCVVGGEKYRSKRESKRHQELLLLERAGSITGLQREVAYTLAPATRFVGANRATPALRYLADFTYTDVATGAKVVEDAKGVRTEGYRIKRHLMRTVHGITVVEV